MADVELTYKGSTIGSLSDSGSLTLETAGCYCEADIGVQYTSPGGGGGGTKLNTEGFTAVSSNESVYPASGYNGSIEVAKTPVLTNSWDFTKGLTDSVGGLTATLANGATQDSSGITIGGATQYVSTGIYWSPYKTYEFDVASMSKSFTSGHGRVFMTNGGSEGFIWNSGGTWQTYFVTWSGSGGSSSLAGKTVTIKTTGFTRLLNGVSSDMVIAHIYLDGTLWLNSSNSSSKQTQYTIMLGAPSNSYYNMVITGFRVYDGVTF